MKEKKRRGIFFSKGIKAFHITIFLLAVGIFTASGIVLFGLFQSGFRPEDLGKKSNTVYEETYDCGKEAGQFIHHLASACREGKPFFTKGKIDPAKTVDITDLEATGKKQNKNTTYTIETLNEMLNQSNIAYIRDALYIARNGYYDEDSFREETETADTSTQVLETELAEYSAEFRYLYSRRIDAEGLTPVSGEYLADYAKKNPDTVSLIDLYEDLCQTADRLESYYEWMEYLNQETNLMFVVENTDTGAVYTNVPEWEKGYGEGEERLISNSSPLFFQAERKDGKLEIKDKKNLSEAEKEIQNWLDELELTGENEKIVMTLDVGYQINDIFSQNSHFYTKYAGLGNFLLLWMAISLFFMILSVILLTVQAGRIRADRELHLNILDRIPTEVALAAAVILAVLMGVLAVWELDMYIWDLFPAVLTVAGEMALGAVLLCAYLSIIRRLKGHLMWSNSLCHTIVKSCKSVYMARKTSSRMIIAFVLLVMGNLLSILIFGGFGILIALVGDGVVLLYLIRENAGRQVIKDGLARIASGELDFKINAKELIGDNREMAEAVNHVGDGLQNAVKETLKSERLKADLITNVSHDIKTPLTSIINYVDLLKREDIRDPKVKGYIDILDNKSQRLKQLTEDLVEASKISSGNVVLDMQPIRFGELVWQTNGEFEEKFEARGLELVCRIPEEPMMIMADGRRMWRVVENLYNNVAKYAMKNTRVYVEVKKIGCRVIFEIKNISERPLNFKAEELTERFIRGDVSRSTEGSGLGLSIAQNLVKLQNGTFDIYLDGDLFKVTITFEAVENKGIK